MDLAELGVSIDPKPAVDGANQIVSALQSMGTAAEAMAASIERSALRTQNAFLGLSGDGLTALRTEIQNIATRLGESTSGIERSADRLNAALAGISLPANNAVSAGFTDMATAANSSAASIERSAQQTTQALTSIGASGIDQTTTKITAMATSAQGAAGTIQRSANDAQTALSSIGGTATREVTSGLDSIAISATKVATTLDSTANQTRSALQSIVTNGTQPVSAGMSQLTSKTGETAQSLEDLVKKSQAAFDAMSASSKNAASAVTQTQEAVKRRSWETGSALERQGTQAQTGFNAMATSAKTAGTAVAQAQDGIKRRSWETGDAIQRQAQQSKTAFQVIATSAKNAASGFAGFATAMGFLAKQVAITLAILGTVTLALSPLIAIMLPLIAAFKAVTFSFGLFRDGLNKAGQFESLKLSLAGALGSMEAAEKRMIEIRRLANETPFGTSGITEAVVTMETATGGLYANEEAIISIGNAAAKAKVPIEQMAEVMAQLFTGLKSGVNFDDPLRRLTSGGMKGVLEPQVYAQLMNMNKEGAKFADMWAVVVKQLERAKGAMENYSKTYEGRLATMTDKWNSFKTMLGEAIRPTATTAVIQITNAIERLDAYFKDAKIKEQLQDIADSALAVFNVMTSSKEGFNTTLRAAADIFTKTMDDGFVKTGEKILEWVKTKFGVDIKAGFEAIRNADIWNILETEILPKMAMAFANALKTAITEKLGELGDKLLLGLPSRSGQGIGAREARLGAAPALISQIPTNPAGGFIMGREMAEERGAAIPVVPGIGGLPQAAPFGFDDSLLPQSYVPSEGATGADLLPDLRENTQATNALTDVISNVRRASQNPQTWGFPIQKEVTDMGPDNSLFGMMTPETESVLKAQRLIQQEKDKILTDRASVVESITIPPRSTQTMEGGRGLKPPREPKRDPMEIEAERITSQMRNPEEVYRDTVENLQKLRDKFADTGKFTTDTFNRAMVKAKDDYTAAVKAMEAAAKAAAEANMTELQKLGAQWSDVGKMVDQANVQIAQSIHQNLTNAFVSLVDGTASAGEAFSRMADQMVADLLRIITQMGVAIAMGKIIGIWNPAAGKAVETALMPGGMGGLFGGGKTAAPAAATAAVAHEGGIVGQTNRSRVTNPAIFRSAPRYHEGGMVGLQPGEEPIIAQKGEVITTEDQERMRARLRGDNKQAKQQIAVTNVNVVDATMIDEHLTKNPDALINVISRNKTRVKQILSIQG